MAGTPKDERGKKQDRSDPTGGASFEEVVRTFLRKPPKPQSRKREESPLASGDYFLVVGDQMRIAHAPHRNDDGSITAALYRNLDDYRSGRVMEPKFTYWL